MKLRLIWALLAFSLLATAPLLAQDGIGMPGQDSAFRQIPQQDDVSTPQERRLSETSRLGPQTTAETVDADDTEQATAASSTLILYALIFAVLALFGVFLFRRFRLNKVDA